MISDKISDLLPLLQRFPQDAYLICIGDRGVEDLRVAVLRGVGSDVPYFKIDAPDEDLPWLKSPGDRLLERIRALRAAGMEFEEATKTAKGEQP